MNTEMTLKLQETIDLSRFDSLPDHSRVWIYQADKILSDEQAGMVDVELIKFAKQWSSHSQSLVAQSQFMFNSFIVLMVDEAAAGASGCSIDSSVHYITNLGNNIGVDFMNRMIFATFNGGEVKLLDRKAFAKAFADGSLKEDSIVFDNLVNTKQLLRTSWLKELGLSWHKRMV